MSDVYFSDFRVKLGSSPLKKLKKLIIAAGIDKIDFNNKYVAVKVHFGEWGNTTHLRQQYSKIICDYIKEKGGKPFLTDTTTLYVGLRNNAVDHLNCANLNGFNALSTGANPIIADGLKGTDEREIEVEGAKHCKVAKVASNIVEADVMVVITHAKCHHQAGFGGIMKNVGMGCASKAGKMEMHNAGSPAVRNADCIGCGVCTKHCNYDAISIKDNKAVIDDDKCKGCGYCLSHCTQDAIYCKWDLAESIMSEKLSEYTKAALKDKPAFFITFAKDVTPQCDCNPSSDTSLVPDVGMFAGFDPVAIDQAAADAINSQPLMANSQASEAAEKIHVDMDNKDVFKLVHPDVAWQDGLAHAEKLGIGSRQYNIKNVGGK